MNAQQKQSDVLLDDTPLGLHLTGNPFVDGGLAVVMAYRKKTPGDISRRDIWETAEFLLPILVEPSWIKAQYKVFPNSKITHPSTLRLSATKKQGNVAEFWKRLFNAERHDELRCLAYGHLLASHYLDRSQVPLGPATVNFLPSWATGEHPSYSGEAALLIQFLPAFLFRGSNPLLVHARDPEVFRVIGKRAVDHACSVAVHEGLPALAPVREMGISTSGSYSKPQNALFDIAIWLLSESAERQWKEDVGLRIYAINNFGTSGKVDFYDLPHPVFLWLQRIVKHGFLAEWRNVARRGYVEPKKNAEVDAGTTFNHVYRRLLEGKSIVSFFFRGHPPETYCTWDNLVTSYLEEIRNMTKEQIEEIRELGNRLEELIHDQPKGIRWLLQAKRQSDFRAQLLYLARLAQKKGMGQPLITFDQAVQLLTKRMESGELDWNEVKDLLLFRIYEVGHEWLKSTQELLDTDDKEGVS